MTTVASIQPGAWNRTSLLLSPATAEETGYVQISMETDRVVLMTP